MAASGASPTGGRKLTLGFGLVNVPIALKPLMDATRKTGGNYLCKTHMCRTKSRYECEVGGHLLEDGERVLGYPVPGTDQYVILDETTVQMLAEERTGVAKIERVVPFADVDPIYLGKAYLCYPQKDASADPFNLVRALLQVSTQTQEGAKALVVTAVLSKQTVQLVIRWCAELGVVVAHQCEFAERIRSNDVQLAQGMAGDVDDTMLEVAGPLLETLAGEFDGEAVSDTYTLALDEAIAAAGAGTPLTVSSEKPGAPKAAVDLMDALRASLADAKEVAPAAKRPARKASGRKARAA